MIEGCVCVCVYPPFILPLGIYVFKAKTYMGHTFLRTGVTYCSIFHSSKKLETQRMSMSEITAAPVTAQTQPQQGREGLLCSFGRVNESHSR